MEDHNPSDQGIETGLEDGMRKVEVGETVSYPIRPGDPDCIHYLRTGFCGYGDRCRFNHPFDRSTSLVPEGSTRIGGGSYPDRPEQPICQHYMRTGSCKFGSSCKYQHPRQGAGSIGVNIYGYPMRPGEKECAYYMKMEQCKFGMTCKFDHPQPSNVPMAAVAPSASSPATQHYGVVAGDWPVVRPTMIPGPYIQGAYGTMLLAPGVVPAHGWAPYLVPNPATIPTNPSTVGAEQLYGVTQLSPSAPPYTRAYQALPSATPSSIILKEQSFPQRPGKPECQHYLKTGECKFGSSCKYHHPEEWIAPDLSSPLSPMGLPLRPGTPTCSYYSLHGVCKYGPACKYDHPMGGTLSYTPSASSLSDMPVTPYPLVGTLAASSSLSDLRAEESVPLASSVGLSCGSSELDISGSISQSGIQQSSSGTETTDHGDAPS